MVAPRYIPMGPSMMCHMCSWILPNLGTIVTSFQAGVGFGCDVPGRQPDRAGAVVGQLRRDYGTQLFHAGIRFRLSETTRATRLRPMTVAPIASSDGLVT